MTLNITKEESLWASLHDGMLESLISDRLARSVTLIVEILYLCEFHKLSMDTRFHITLENVSSVEALAFSAWPGDVHIPEGLSYEEKERVRKAHYAKGRSESISWESLAVKLQQTEDYDIQNALLVPIATNRIQLKMDIMNQVTHDYPEIRLTAENVRFWMQPVHRELSPHEFVALGDAYWERPRQ